MKALKSDKVLERISEAVLAQQSKENAVVPLLKKQLAETEKQIDNMVSAIAQGVVMPSTKQKLNDLGREKENLGILLSPPICRK